MKKIIVLLSVVSAISIVSGCDGFRAFYGKPTSDDIDEMRAELFGMKTMELSDEGSSGNADSLEVDSLMPDTSGAAPAVSTPSDPTPKPVQEAGVKSPEAEKKRDGSQPALKKYYVIAGVFRNVTNAEKLADRLNKDGYGARLLTFENGMKAVAFSGTDNKDEAQAGAASVVASGKYDISQPWVYDTATGRHKR